MKKLKLDEVTTDVSELNWKATREEYIICIEYL